MSKQKVFSQKGATEDRQMKASAAFGGWVEFMGLYVYLYFKERTVSKSCFVLYLLRICCFGYNIDVQCVFKTDFEEIKCSQFQY